MRIVDFVSPNTFAVGVEADGKKQALLEVASRLASSARLSKACVFKALVERENLGSTAFGRGVAIPHARVNGIDRIYAAVIQLAKPVEFVATGSRWVDLICAIIAPEEPGSEPGEALASVCRTLRTDGIVEQLRWAKNSDALYAALAGPGEAEEVNVGPERPE